MAKKEVSFDENDLVKVIIDGEELGSIEWGKFEFKKIMSSEELSDKLYACETFEEADEVTREAFRELGVDEDLIESMLAMAKLKAMFNFFTK